MWESAGFKNGQVPTGNCKLLIRDELPQQRGSGNRTDRKKKLLNLRAFVGVLLLSPSMSAATDRGTDSHRRILQEYEDRMKQSTGGNDAEPNERSRESRRRIPLWEAVPSCSKLQDTDSHTHRGRSTGTPRAKDELIWVLICVQGLTG
jgi:hypothetical protein